MKKIAIRRGLNFTGLIKEDWSERGVRIRLLPKNNISQAYEFQWYSMVRKRKILLLLKISYFCSSVIKIWTSTDLSISFDLEVIWGLDTMFRKLSLSLSLCFNCFPTIWLVVECLASVLLLFFSLFSTFFFLKKSANP